MLLSLLGTHLQEQANELEVTFILIYFVHQYENLKQALKGCLFCAARFPPLCQITGP